MKRKTVRELDEAEKAAKDAYSAHRDECNTCNSDELCDIGCELHEAWTVAGEDRHE